jgi:hypothetical protein
MIPCPTVVALHSPSRGNAENLTTITIAKKFTSSLRRRAMVGAQWHTGGSWRVMLHGHLQITCIKIVDSARLGIHLTPCCGGWARLCDRVTRITRVLIPSRSWLSPPSERPASLSSSKLFNPRHPIGFLRSLCSRHSCDQIFEG